MSVGNGDKRRDGRGRSGRIVRRVLGAASGLVLLAALIVPAAHATDITNPAQHPAPITVTIDGQTYHDGLDTLPGYDDYACTPIPDVQYDFADNEILYYDDSGNLLATAHWTEWSRISSYKTWLAQQGGSSSASSSSASSSSSMSGSVSSGSSSKSSTSKKAAATKTATKKTTTKKASTVKSAAAKQPATTTAKSTAKPATTTTATKKKASHHKRKAAVQHHKKKAKASKKNPAVKKHAKQHAVAAAPASAGGGSSGGGTAVKAAATSAHTAATSSGHSAAGTRIAGVAILLALALAGAGLVFGDSARHLLFGRGGALARRTVKEAHS